MGVVELACVCVPNCEENRSRFPLFFREPQTFIPTEVKVLMEQKDDSTQDQEQLYTEVDIRFMREALKEVMTTCELTTLSINVRHNWLWMRAKFLWVVYL